VVIVAPESHRQKIEAALSVRPNRQFHDTGTLGSVATMEIQYFRPAVT
jgi:hypothetical protein